MKTKSASQSASFSRRLLIGLSLLAGVFTLPLLLLLSNPATAGGNSAAPAKQKSPERLTATMEKRIVASGSVAMNLDLNRLNGLSSATQKLHTLDFVVKPNSFFTILLFNNLLSGPEIGAAMTLIPQNSATLPAPLRASFNHLVIEKSASNAAVDLAVRDGKGGFVFFNIEGSLYDYDANAQLLTIEGGRLLISNEFANALGRPADAGVAVGQISVGATMQAIEITEINGETRLPPLHQPLPGTVPGPDVIIGELIGLVQLDNGAVGGRVGVSLGTDACNKGTVNVNWFALPSNDHPFIPQNVYRMSGGADNTQRFEQIGQSWGKHAFTAASSNTCGFGCNGVGGDHLGSGCSDAYGPGLNGSQTGIGSRAWVNPFTGSFPGSTANNHSGHAHDVTSHRILIET